MIERVIAIRHRKLEDIKPPSGVTKLFHAAEQRYYHWNGKRWLVATKAIFISSPHCMGNGDADECRRLRGQVVEKEQYPPLYEGCMCHVICTMQKKGEYGPSV